MHKGRTAPALLSLVAGLSCLGVDQAAAKKQGSKHRPAVIATDTVAKPDPLRFWGQISCASPTRHRRIAKGGDRHRSASGKRQKNAAFRRLTVFDGDDFFGERCELGDEQAGRTVHYREGQRRITQLSVRLPKRGFSLGIDTWQAVMQMKQSGPAANSGGTPVLQLDAYNGRWRLRQSDSPLSASDSHELWSAPAKAGVWTRFSFDVRYSQNPALGSIRVSADLNGDRDFRDRGERGKLIRTYTLKTETPGGGLDAIAPGQSIASHLRVGIYHHPIYACPAPRGCFVDLDNVQVLKPRR